MTFRLRYLVPRKDDFNSHAHVERDLKEENELVTSAISTHTLTWSVTSEHILQFGILAYFNSHAHVERDRSNSVRHRINHISTHTLTWSVTGRWTRKKLEKENFNSHAHVERDGIKIISLAPCVISTHTLTWSVTGIRIIIQMIIKFQLTRSRGA